MLLLVVRLLPLPTIVRVRSAPLALALPSPAPQLLLLLPVQTVCLGVVLRAPPARRPLAGPLLLLPGWFSVLRLAGWCPAACRVQLGACGLPIALPLALLAWLAGVALALAPLLLLRRLPLLHEALLLLPGQCVGAERGRVRAAAATCTLPSGPRGAALLPRLPTPPAPPAAPAAAPAALLPLGRRLCKGAAAAGRTSGGLRALPVTYTVPLHLQKQESRPAGADRGSRECRPQACDQRWSPKLTHETLDTERCVIKAHLEAHPSWCPPARPAGAAYAPCPGPHALES